MDLQAIMAAAKGMFGGTSNAFADAGDSGGGDPPKGATSSNIKLKDSLNIKSGDFDKEHITNLVKAAKATGVDPHQLLALDWQESNFGGSAAERAEQKIKEAKVAGIKTESGRSYRDRSKLNVGQIQDVENPKELGELATKTGIDSKYLAPALALRDKIRYAKQLGFNDPAMQLQAYNGYGKVNVGANKYYGQTIPGGVIDMRKTPLYGKRLLSLAADLKNNKEINSLILGTNNSAPIQNPSAIASR